MSPQLTLYTFALSLWAGAGRLGVYELDIPNIEFVQVDLSKAENFSPEFSKINPHHTIPALKINDNGKEDVKTDTKSVVDYFNTLAGKKLDVPDKKAEIDAFLKHMHEEADVGNPLFVLPGSPEELAAKKDMVTGFLSGRIQGWENYIKVAPEHADLYNKNIKEAQGLIYAYTSGHADQLYALNKQLWEAGQAFLDKAEALLKANGDFLFGKYSVAEIHFTPYLFRDLLVRKPEQVFENRPNLEAYYKRLQARPSFAKTFN
jgi:glutathione S-transferase